MRANVLVVLIAFGATSAANAQHRLVVAGGPAIGYQHAPPSYGLVGRVSLSVLRPERRFSLQLDAHGTWLAPGSQFTWTGAKGDVLSASSVHELQLGGSAVVVVAPFHARVRPYLLIGADYYVSRIFTENAVSGPSYTPFTVHRATTRWASDPVLGAGIAVQHGARRWLFEVRPHTGIANYLAVTTGVSF